MFIKAIVLTADNMALLCEYTTITALTLSPWKPLSHYITLIHKYVLPHDDASRMNWVTSIIENIDKMLFLWKY